MADRDGLNAAANEVVIANATGDADLFHEKVTSLIAMVRALPESPQPAPHAMTEAIKALCHSVLGNCYLGKDEEEKLAHSLLDSAVSDQPAAAEPAKPVLDAELRLELEKLIKWKHCMSYNDSYFTEPAGDLKRVTYQIDRILSRLDAAMEPARKSIDAQGAEEIAKWSKQYGVVWSVKQLRDMDVGTKFYVQGDREPVATVESAAMLIWHCSTKDFAHGTVFYSSPLPAATLGKAEPIGYISAGQMESWALTGGSLNLWAKPFSHYTTPVFAQQPAASDVRDAMQHVAYFDDGKFHWMSGIAARNCELYTPAVHAGKGEL